MKRLQHQSIIHLIPFIGIGCFVLLYLFSSTLYPGGSQANLNTIGFDWTHNYWCNLMNYNSMNGQLNPARPFSITAMVILCFSLMSFFIQFAKTFSKNKFWRLAIIICGIISMTFAALIFTPYHDLMTLLSSVFGLVVVIGMIREIYLSRMRLFKLSGIGCILLLGLNNYIYYSHHYIELLPLLQKITFAIVLIWILGLNFIILKNNILKEK